MKIIKEIKNTNIREIFQGMSIALFYKVLGLILGYLVIYQINIQYGSAGVGEYGITLSILIILGVLLNMGTETALLRYIGEYGEEDLRSIKTIYSKMVSTVVAITLLVSIITYINSQYILNWISVNGEFEFILIIFVIIVPIYTINMLNIELIRGLGNITLSEYIRGVNQPLLVAVVLFLVSNVDNIPILALGFSAIVSFIITTTYVKKIFKDIKRYQNKFLSIGKILKNSMPLQIASLGSILLANVDNLMIGAMQNASSVGYYLIAFKISLVASFFLVSMNAATIPKFSKYYWSKNYKKLEETISVSIKTAFYLSVCYCVFVILFAEDILYFFGEDYINAKYTLIVLIIGQVINSYFGAVGVYLSVTGREVIVGMVAMVSVFVNIALNYLLIDLYGITGAAIATTISIFLWKFPLAIYVKKQDNIAFYYIPKMFS
jgi:O-antigen/teichoic acid export membrane protein